MMGKQKGNLKERYVQALDLEVALDELRRLYCFEPKPKLAACYDFERIGRTFRSYTEKGNDERYFRTWCGLYAMLIQRSYEVKTREDIVYVRIARCLSEVEDGADPNKAFAEIEEHNRVIIGESEANYWLASDEERFCVYYIESDYDDREFYFIDFLEIDHKKKTFILARNITDTSVDGWDELDDEIRTQAVSRTVFELICENLPKVGYREGGRKK